MQLIFARHTTPFLHCTKLYIGEEGCNARIHPHNPSSASSPRHRTLPFFALVFSSPKSPTRPSNTYTLLSQQLFRLKSPFPSFKFSFSECDSVGYTSPLFWLQFQHSSHQKSPTP